MCSRNPARCQEKVGNSFCYKELGHDGEHYETRGLEAEALVQKMLVMGGRSLTKATRHEDEDQKVDFWVAFNEEEIGGFKKVFSYEQRDFISVVPRRSLIGGMYWIPIQFTIRSWEKETGDIARDARSEEARKKVFDALNRGIIVFRGDEDRIFRWRDAANDDVKLSIARVVTDEFMKVVTVTATTYNFRKTLECPDVVNDRDKQRFVCVQETPTVALS